MLLYGTITSERATKGQGGNKFIRAEFRVGSADNSVLMTTLELIPEKNGDYVLIMHNKSGRGIDSIEVDRFNPKSLETKGKRQKGECKHLAVSKYAENKGYCDNCGEDLRGDEVPEGALHQ